MNRYRTLIIDRPGAVLRVRAGRLFWGDERLSGLPLQGLQTVLLRPGATIHASALGALHEAGITVAVINSRRPRRNVSVPGAGAGVVERRFRQILLAADGARALVLARCLVLLRARNARRFLARVAAVRHDRRRLVQAARRRLAVAVQMARTADDIAALRAAEGHIARAEFAVLRGVLPRSLGFRRRERRPPPCPTNALISLGATCLIAHAQSALVAAGLDPYFGVYHALENGRPAAACDLIEPLRPLLHEAIWRLFAERRLTADDFYLNQGACRLRDGRGAAFYQAMAPTFQSAQAWLFRAARRIARILEDSR